MPRRSRLFAALLAAVLAGCASSPPAPPSCDGAARRPLNGALNPATAPAR